MKHRFFSTLTKLSLSTGIAVLLAACGGSSGSTGTLSLAITDAPVDDAAAVVVTFTGVELQGSGGLVDYDFEELGIPTPKTIDLLALTDGKTELLLDGLTLEAGSYSWMRLKVNAEEGVVEDDSYIQLVTDGHKHSLYIPSGGETGLKLNRPFVVHPGGDASFTIDFDLRKSVNKPSNDSKDYKLRPTLRIVEQSNVGTLTGTIASATISASNNSSDCAPAVYVFNTVDSVDDIDGTADPITTTNATANLDGSADYTVAFLTEGDYKIAFTCDAANDDPEIDDTGVGSTEKVSFSGETIITIVQGETTQSDF